jgi:hypothetical protein
MNIIRNPGTCQSTTREDAILARFDHSSHNKAFGVTLMREEELLFRHMPAVREEPEKQE